MQTTRVSCQDRDREHSGAMYRKQKQRWGYINFPKITMSGFNHPNKRKKKKKP